MTKVATRRWTALATTALAAWALAACTTGEPSPIPSTSSTSTPLQPSVPAAPTGPEAFTPLVLTSLGQDPVPVTGSDRKTHLAYELQILNAAPRPATITTIETLSEGGTETAIATLSRQQVVSRTILVGDYTLPPVPAAEIPPGRTALVVMDAAFDSPTAVPARLSHRVSATFGEFLANQGDFAQTNFPASTVAVGGVVSKGTGSPEVIGPPLVGPDWVAVNACCDLSPHRGAMVPIGGRINGAERYAVDWSRFDLSARPIVDLVNQRQATFAGPADDNSSYFTFGQPVLAVADATVVTVVNDLPEAPPRVVLKGLPVADLGGNRVVLKIRDGVYAFYAHLKTGSVSVKPGGTVRRGQVIANAGNSGNTTESHLHFHLMDGVEPLTATNLPWEIDAFRYLGQVSPETVDAAETGDRTKELPLINSAETFPIP
jgi:hypothetical protein